MKILHTADLQIGARFSRFGGKAKVLRNARLTTLKRILNIGRQKGVDGVIIAGDMFESNQIANDVVEEAFHVISSYPEIPIVILPGNHDPMIGPGCIWQRRPFNQPPNHVTVCTTSDAIELTGGVILPVPITQKVSTKDPSLPLIEMATSIAGNKIRIGVTHGALAIEGKHQPNDHPIALNAASRAGLDYLAIGHWHQQQSYDDGRLAMPGTPEPDDFEQNSGSVTLVEIASRGAEPEFNAIPSATYSWHAVKVDLLNRELTLDLFKSALAEIKPPAKKRVLRIELVGPVTAENRELLEKMIADVSKEYAVVLVEDRTSIILSESMWKVYLQEHPLLAQVVTEVDGVRCFHSAHKSAIEVKNFKPMTINEF